MQLKKVLVLDSDDLGWGAAMDWLAAQPEVEVVGRSGQERNARRIAMESCPDLVIAAAEIDGQSTGPLLTEIRQTICPAARLAVFTSVLDSTRIAAFAKCRLAGYLLWGDLSPETLANTLSILLHADLRVASREIAEIAVVTRPPVANQAVARGMDSPVLTTREQSVLRLLGQGFACSEIATTGGWSQRTVARDIEELESKFDAVNRFVLAYKATLLGFLP